MAKTETYKVYCWTNKVNGKRYVGMTCRSMKKRAGKDMYFYHGSAHFYAAIQKYGIENFSYRILVDGLTKEQAAQKEKNYIQRYRLRNPEFGYNIRKGGCYAFTGDTDISRAQRISATLHEQRSKPEYRAIMSQRMQKVWDDPERAAKMRKARIGKPHGGMPDKPIYCAETKTRYPSLCAAAKALDLSRSTIHKAFRKGNGTVAVGLKKGTPYHLTKV